MNPKTRSSQIGTIVLGLAGLCAAVAARAEELPDMTVGLGFGVPANGLAVKSLVPGITQTVNLRPSTVNELGVFFRYKWLGASYYFDIPASRQIRDAEGRSEYFDYRVGYYDDWWGIEGSWSKYQGFLIDPSQGVVSASTLNGAKYYRIPDLSDVGYGVNLFYVFSPEHYSLAAGLSQTDIQKESGGSFLLIPSYRWQGFSNSGQAILPAELQGAYGPDGGISEGTLKSIGVAAGYGYNWLPNPAFYVSGILAVGAGWQNIQYKVVTPAGTTDNSASSVSANVHARVGFGVNARKFLSGLYVYFDQHNHDTNFMEIGNEVYGVRLFVGLRFGEPEPAVKPTQAPDGAPATP